MPNEQLNTVQALDDVLYAMTGFRALIKGEAPSLLDYEGGNDAVRFDDAIDSLRALIARLSQEPAAAQAGAGGVLSDERAAFEKRMHTDGWRNFNGYWDGGWWFYDLPDLNSRWIGWQRRASHPQGAGKGGGSDSDGAREDQRG